MDALLRDIRFGLKLLWKEKAFSGTVLLTLAICIGSNVAIFSVIHTVLLEPLPYQDADRLVTMFNSYPGAGAERASNGSFDYFQRRENVAAFEEVAAYQGFGNTVGEPGATERVSSMQVTPSFFALLGVEPVLGRAFTEDEMDVGNHQKVILTHGYWQERFGGAADVVGRDLRVDGQPFTVVGVLPEDFRVVNRPDTRFFLPIPFTEAERTIEAWHSNNYQMMARLAPGATIEQALAQVDAMNEALIDSWPLPNARQLLADARYHVRILGAQEDLVGDVRPMLYMLFAGVAFVLLIGCVNIANLMLARSQVRRGELATKLAMGAQRLRVARQVLTEAIVIALVGGALGVGVGALGLRLLTILGADDLPRGTEIAINGPVLLFTVVLAMGAGVLFGAIPVTHVLRGDLSAVFRTETRTGTSSRKAVLLRSSLVTGQVALAFLMLIGAGLMFMSFRAALRVEPGFDPKGVFTAFVSLPEARYPDGEARRQFTDELLGEVGSIPGVRHASVTNQLPFSGSNSSSVIMPEGYMLAPGESLLSPYRSVVGADYFEAMGIPVLEGRAFQASDGPDQPNAIVLDEWLARRYFPDSSPLGKRMYQGVPGMDSIPESNYATIVGVVASVKQNDLTASDAEHVGAYYYSVRQQPMGFQTLVVRTDLEAADLTSPVRDALARLDSELPLFGVETLQSRMDESLVSRRAPMALLLVFAGVAMFLAVIGIYGALAYSVTQRTREMGIRLAMGSDPAGIFRIVVGQGLRVTGLGLAVGILASLGLVRLIESMLFGVQPTDVRVMAVVAVALALVAFVACVIPAWRATRVDPVTALNYQ
jgi:predicted permease